VRHQRTSPLQNPDIHAVGPRRLNDPKRTPGQRALTRRAFGCRRGVCVLSVSADDAFATPKLREAPSAAGLQIGNRHPIIDGFECIGSSDVTAFDEVESVLIHECKPYSMRKPWR